MIFLYAYLKSISFWYRPLVCSWGDLLLCSGGILHSKKKKIMHAYMYPLPYLILCLNADMQRQRIRYCPPPPLLSPHAQAKCSGRVDLFQKSLCNSLRGCCMRYMVSNSVNIMHYIYYPLAVQGDLPQQLSASVSKA